MFFSSFPFDDNISCFLFWFGFLGGFFFLGGGCFFVGGETTFKLHFFLYSVAEYHIIMSHQNITHIKIPHQNVSSITL